MVQFLVLKFQKGQFSKQWGFDREWSIMGSKLPCCRSSSIGNILEINVILFSSHWKQCCCSDIYICSPWFMTWTGLETDKRKHYWAWGHCCPGLFYCFWLNNLRSDEIIVIVICVKTTCTLGRRYRHSKDLDATGNQVQKKYRQTGPTNEVI